MITKEKIKEFLNNPSNIFGLCIVLICILFIVGKMFKLEDTVTPLIIALFLVIPVLIGISYFIDKFKEDK